MSSFVSMLGLVYFSMGNSHVTRLGEKNKSSLPPLTVATLASMSGHLCKTSNCFTVNQSSLHNISILDLDG